MEGGLQCWAHILCRVVSVPVQRISLVSNTQGKQLSNIYSRCLGGWALSDGQDVERSPQLGRDEEVVTLGVAGLQGCMEAVADGWLVEVVAGTVDVPAKDGQSVCRPAISTTLLPERAFCLGTPDRS